MGYMEATESLKYPFLITGDTSPSRAVLEVFKLSPSDGCPATVTCLASTRACDPDACPLLRRFRIVSSHTGQTGAPHRSDRSDPPVRPLWRCCSTVFDSSVLALWINQGTQWFFGEPPETLRTRCSLRQSPLMTRLPRSPGSILVLRLNQEIVHDFILLFTPPCGPHLTPLATGSRTKPTCLLHTWRTHQRRPFTLVLHLHQHESSRNLHLQYLDKNQSTQHCQSLITQGSDHPPVLEPHMVLTITRR
jgi:hypothetical protein